MRTAAATTDLVSGVILPGIDHSVSKLSSAGGMTGQQLIVRGRPDFVSRDTKSDVDFLVCPTGEMYVPLQWACNSFNESLFDGKLPPLMLTLRGKGKQSAAYYVPAAFETRDHAHQAAEIALNPAMFTWPQQAILALLLHQIVHHWQHVEGDASRPTYHNRQWAEKMVALGLQPTSTGTVGGKTTGQAMDQFPIAGGLFERVCAELIDQGFDLVWRDILGAAGALPKSPRKKLVAVIWVCPQCGDQAKAARSVRLGCMGCGIPLVLVEPE